MGSPFMTMEQEAEDPAKILARQFTSVYNAINQLQADYTEMTEAIVDCPFISDQHKVEILEFLQLDRGITEVNHKVDLHNLIEGIQDA